MFDNFDQAVGPREVVPWSEYGPDGLLADLIEASRAEPAPAHPDDRAAQILERIGGWERVIAWAQASQLAEMAEFVRHAERQPRYGQWMSEAQESAVAEVGLMLGVAQRTAAARVDTALDLVERLPAVHRALSRGRLSLAAARAIAEESATLDGPAAAAVAATVLAGSAHRTPGSAARRHETRGRRRRPRRAAAPARGGGAAARRVAARRAGWDGAALGPAAGGRRRHRLLGDRPSCGVQHRTWR